MYFEACEQLADQRPELRGTIEAVDGLLCKNQGRTVALDFLSSYLTAPRRELAFVFESLQTAADFSTRLISVCREHGQPLVDGRGCDLCDDDNDAGAIDQQVLQIPTLQPRAEDAADEQPPPRVLISYSHDSSEHDARVLRLADQLRAHGVDCHIDRYTPVPSEGWPVWMQRQLEKAKFILCVCSANYRNRFSDSVAPDVGRGVSWEANLIRNDLYHTKATANGKYLVVQFDRFAPELVPPPLQGFACFALDDLNLSSDGYERLYRHLTNQPATPITELGPRVRLEQPPRQSEGAPEQIPADEAAAVPAPKDFNAKHAKTFKRNTRRWAVPLVLLVLGIIALMTLGGSIPRILLSNSTSVTVRFANRQHELVLRPIALEYHLRDETESPQQAIFEQGRSTIPARPDEFTFVPTKRIAGFDVDVAAGNNLAPQIFLHPRTDPVDGTKSYKDLLVSDVTKLPEFDLRRHQQVIAHDTDGDHSLIYSNKTSETVDVLLYYVTDGREENENYLFDSVRESPQSYWELLQPCPPGESREYPFGREHGHFLVFLSSNALPPQMVSWDTTLYRDAVAKLSIARDESGQFETESILSFTH